MTIDKIFPSDTRVVLGIFLTGEGAVSFSALDLPFL